MTARAGLRHRTVADIAVQLVIVVLWVTTATAQETIDYDRLDTPGWERIGGFRGATGPNLLGRVNDLLFEQEANGTLYRDLGDVTLGLGWNPDNGLIRWENSFYRRVLPLHREIEPGGVVTGDDLSSYLDIKTLISRGRVRVDWITDIVGESGAISSQVEGGVSLSLGRIHPPLELGDRELTEALDDPDRGIVKLTQKYPEGESKSLLRLATEGAAGLTQWIANQVGDRTVDTERASIFYESYGDTVSLFLDVGLPVAAEPFREHDPRLGPGDFVRQITFVGLAPIGAGLGLYGVESSYQHFYRYLRETTIVKERGGKVLVQVRTALAKGDETTPLKVRPEIEIFGILTLGYTFFEQVYTISKTTSYETAFRIDLNDPRGMRAFEELLGDGQEARIKPLAEAAVERDGAERLAEEVRRGDNRSALRRFRCFGLFDYRRSRVAANDLIEAEGHQLYETSLANSWTRRKKLGRDVNLSRQLLIRSFRDVAAFGADFEQRRRGSAAAVSLITGIRDQHADGYQVRRSTAALRRALEWDDHPLLDELAALDPDTQTRFALNLSLALDEGHVHRLVDATEDEVWTELADVLLGTSLRDVWSTADKRAAWRQAARKSTPLNRTEVVAGDAIDLKDKPVKPMARYRLARRSVKNFQRVQKASGEGECLSCLTRAFKKWESASMMQILIARLATQSPGDEIGYHYEVFIDEMLRPSTVANDVELDLPLHINISDTVRAAVVGQRGFEPEVESVANTLRRDHATWQGDRFLQPSLSRLEGGIVLLNVGAETPIGHADPPCLMLRLYSDMLFDEDLSLRIDLRQRRTIGADVPLGHAEFQMGEPAEITETPFMSSRYSYDIPLPVSPDRLRQGKSYSMLLRVLNADGLPVSEEQQVSLIWPEGGLRSAADGCDVPALLRP